MTRTATSPTDPARLRRLAQQFLVHCFLYYRLAEPVIEDADFDRIAEALYRLRQAEPGTPLPYGEVLEAALGPEASGFSIRAYPPDIVTTAFKLLYALSPQEMEFQEFVERRGYRVEEEGQAPGSPAR
jgi:hypothetical protein